MCKNMNRNFIKAAAMIHKLRKDILLCYQSKQYRLRPHEVSSTPWISKSLKFRQHQRTMGSGGSRRACPL